MYVLNDLHLGVKRTAGTTPASQAALAEWQFQMLDKLLTKLYGADIFINGDLFDTFTVDNRTLLRAFDAFMAAAHCNHTLYLSAGNHDLSKDSSKVSSLEVLAAMLNVSEGSNVELITKPTQLATAHVIPHLANQDLFDGALSLVPSDSMYVLLHCNYDNHFAEQSDHSLNLSERVAMRLPGFVVLGHEHQQRSALDEKVIVVGNQIPTSVADCLGPKYKYYAFLDEAVGGVRLEPWLDVSTVFAEIEWTALGAAAPGAKFIRVTGHAAANQAADAVTAIAKFRQQSDAFVITNAIEVEGSSITEGVVASIERAKEFNVIETILSMLDDKERATIARLFGERDAA